MAVTVDECQRMIDACRKHRVKLMIAYRLHFEEINVGVIELVRRGQIGEPKFFNSSFSMTVRAGDIRTKKDLGGGTFTILVCIALMPRGISSEPSRKR